jgi:hypothetical protein
MNQGTNRLKTIIERGAGVNPRKGGSKNNSTGNEQEAIIDAKET